MPINNQQCPFCTLGALQQKGRFKLARYVESPEQPTPPLAVLVYICSNGECGFVALGTK
jgi:hypothetical protein